MVQRRLGMRQPPGCHCLCKALFRVPRRPCFRRAERPVNSRLLPFILLSTFALVSCFGRATDTWDEEVLSHDGRVLVVERSVPTGEVQVELGQPRGELSVPPNSCQTVPSGTHR